MQPLSPDSEASGPALQRTANTPAAAAELPRVRTLSDIFYTSEDLDAEEMPAKFAGSEGAAQGADILRSEPSAQEAQAGVSSRLTVSVVHAKHVTGRELLQLQVCRRGAGRPTVVRLHGGVLTSVTWCCWVGCNCTHVSSVCGLAWHLGEATQLGSAGRAGGSAATCS